MDKTVLITGVSRKQGIGAALAIRLASLGYNIFITYYRNNDVSLPGWEKNDNEVNEIISEIKKYPVKFNHLECDLSETKIPPIIFDKIEKDIGPVYALINNAAFSIDTGWMNDEIHTSLKENAPMGRIGIPDDVANLIEFIISEKSQWITGQIIHSRGGF